jgi:hypothetical protein
LEKISNCTLAGAIAYFFRDRREFFLASVTKPTYKQYT